MKYIKLFENFIKENQLKMFPDYEKSMPDNPKDIGMKYLKDREGEYNKSDNDINTWHEAEQFINDADNRKMAMDRAIDYDDDSSFDTIHFEEISIEDIKPFTFRYIENNFRQEMDREKYLDLFEDVQKISDSSELEAIFNKYDLDWNKFKDIAEEVDKYDQIYSEYYEAFNSWVHSNDGVVYRAMQIPSKLDDLKDIEYKGVGIYWSYEEEGAETHWGSGDKNEIVLVAEVEPEDVNWEESLYKSYYNLSEEMEVVLNVNTSIDITGFKISSSHSLFSEMEDKDRKYFSDVLGLDYNTISKITQNKGFYNIVLDEPMIVRT